LEGVGQNGHPVKRTVLVNAGGKGNNIGREPRRVNSDGADEVGYYVPQQNA
jgi:hypothetical protein